MKVEDLAQSVIKELDLYQMQLNEGISEVYDDVAVEALKLIKSNSKTAGFNDRSYSDSWTKTVKHEVKGAYRVHGVTIHNKKHYRLTHLLEKGHALSTGGRTRSFPHIAPTQEEMDKRIIERLKTKIEETK